MSPQLHTNFIPVTVHTAKCDSCDKHNKLTLYRCVECGQHVCSLCWNKKSGDRNHTFGGGSHNVHANHQVEDHKSEGEREDENRTRTRTRRRARIISDDEDDDLPVSRPALTVKNINASNPNKQHTKRKNIIVDDNHGEGHTPNMQHTKRKDVIMNDNHHEDQADGLPRLQPIVPARKLPVLRPAIPATSTSATESTNGVMQRSSSIHSNESKNKRQDIGQVYDNLGRQTVSSQYAFEGDQQENLEARRPSQPSISHQQANLSAHHHPQPANYRPRPEADVDRQAARNQFAFANSLPTGHQFPRPAHPSIAQTHAPQLAPRQIQSAVYRPRLEADVDRQAALNQRAFANSQPTNRQASDPARQAQPSIAQQHGTHLAPRQIQPAVYRPRLEADVDRQAALNQRAFANSQPTNRQASDPARQAQPSIAQQHGTQLAPRQIQPAISHEQTTNMDQAVALSQQAFHSYQQAVGNANAKQMEARNQQTLSSHQSVRPAVNRDQVAAYNHQAFVSNQQSPSAASYREQMIAARDRQEAYFSRQQPNRPIPGSAHSSVTHQHVTGLHPSPAQASHSQQHTAFLASRQAQHRTAAQDLLHGLLGGAQVREPPPEVLDAAGVLLFYAGTEQVPGVPFRSNQDTDGVSQLLSAADQLDKAKSASGKSRSSSKTFLRASGDAGTQYDSPHGPALNPTPSSTDAGSAKARIEKHRARLAQLHSPSESRNTIVPDVPTTTRAHPNYRHAAVQTDSRFLLPEPSAAQSQGPSSRARSDPGATLPVSDHAATYLNQWNSARASLSSSSNTTAVDAPATLLDHPRSPVPALHPSSTTSVLIKTASGTDEREVLEDRTRAQSAPMSEIEVASDADTVMGRIDAEVLEDDKSPPSEARAPEDNAAGKHPRGEKEGGRVTSKEQKASDDVDVVDARRRNGKENDCERIDDEDSDIEIISVNKSNSKTTEGLQGTKAGANAPRSSTRKGVARVKKLEAKGRKGKTTAPIS